MKPMVYISSVTSNDELKSLQSKSYIIALELCRITNLFYVTYRDILFLNNLFLSIFKKFQ